MFKATGMQMCVSILMMPAVHLGLKTQMGAYICIHGMCLCCLCSARLSVQFIPLYAFALAGPMSRTSSPSTKFKTYSAKVSAEGLTYRSMHKDRAFAVRRCTRTLAFLLTATVNRTP